jgi:hypothetical protein
MANTFVGDNDHGNAGLPLSVTLWAEITQLRQEVVRLNNVIKELKEGFEGCCNACEPVGLMNKKLREERDEARLNLCDMYTRTQPTGCQMKAEDYAHDNDWDCFKALDQRSEFVTNSHKSIITKHNDLFQKLTQDEKTNG